MTLLSSSCLCEYNITEIVREKVVQRDRDNVSWNGNTRRNIATHKSQSSDIGSSIFFRVIPTHFFAQALDFLIRGTVSKSCSRQISTMSFLSVSFTPKT